MRLIDADALMRELMRTINTLQMMDDTETADKMMRGVHIVGNMIRNAPTIDAVEVVRCKDCRHWRTSYCVIHGDSWEETDYCSDGEREGKR